MSKIYICDRCGTRVPEDDRYEIIIDRKDGENEYESATPKDWREKDLCKTCVKTLILLVFPVGLRKPVEEQKPADGPQENKKPYSKPVAKIVPTEKTGRVKKSYVTLADQEQIKTLYLEGMEMEQISDKLQIGMVPISKYIAQTNLGELRYGKKDRRKAEPTCPLDKPEPESQEG